MDTLVWEFILDVMTDREHFEQGLLDAREAERKALTPKRERLGLVEELIVNCEAEAAKLAWALKNVTGGIVEAALQKDIDAVSRQYRALVRERNELHKSLETEELSDEALATALEFREAVIVGMQEATFGDKRQTLEDLRIEVEFAEGKQARVICRIPTAERYIDLDASTLAT